jgi:hemolysin III
MHGSLEDALEKVKPRLRGVFHFVAFFAALGGCAFLAMAPLDGPRYLAGLIYGAGLCAMLGLSALYHRPMWSHRARARLRRVDHAGIFLLIGGTFTPIAVLRAGGHADGWLLAMWGACLMGMVFMVAFSHAHRGLRAAVYVVVGLIAAPLVLSMPGLIGPARVGLIVLGAAIYILGAAVYAKRWPNPDPKVLGYHEIFHLMVVAAAAIHFGVVLDLQYAA